MRITLLQEAIAAGPFLLFGLIVGLVSIFLIFFLGAKFIKLRANVKELESGDDEKQLKEKRTQFVFLALLHNVFRSITEIVGIFTRKLVTIPAQFVH